MNKNISRNLNQYVIFLTDTIIKFPSIYDTVADIEGGKEAEGVWEYGVEENIWT